MSPRWLTVLVLLGLSAGAVRLRSSVRGRESGSPPSGIAPIEPAWAQKRKSHFQNRARASQSHVGALARID